MSDNDILNGIMSLGRVIILVGYSFYYIDPIQENIQVRIKWLSVKIIARVIFETINRELQELLSIF